MKKMFVILGLMVVTGCTGSVDDQTNDLRAIQQDLPNGCVVRYAGEVRVAGEFKHRPARVFYTLCGDVTTTSSTIETQNGKVTYDQTDVGIAIGGQ